MGLAHQGSSDGQHLLLATTEGAGNLGLAFTQNGKQLVNIGQILLDRFIVPAQKSPHFEVFRNGKFGENLSPFRTMNNTPADNFMRCNTVDPVALVPYFSFYIHDAGNGPQQGAFTGAVGSDHADQLPGIELDIHAV